MTSREVVSSDGSWKLVVEAWSINVLIYRALGGTSRVYSKGSRSIWDRLRGAPAGWTSTTADSIGVGAALTVRAFPGVTSVVPGSPDNRVHDSVADCRAWAAFVGIKVRVSPTFDPTTTPSPTIDTRSAIADGVIVSGSATKSGQSLSVSSLTYP
jgi:hypothetical protein